MCILVVKASQFVLLKLQNGLNYLHFIKRKGTEIHRCLEKHLQFMEVFPLKLSPLQILKFRIFSLKKKKRRSLKKIISYAGIQYKKQNHSTSTVMEEIVLKCLSVSFLLTKNSHSVIYLHVYITKLNVCLLLLQFLNFM